MPTRWRFVDSPTTSPTVLLDMNDEVTWKTLGGSDFFRLPSPPLKRTIATNAMTEGGVLASSAYDLRELHFTLELYATSEAEFATQLANLKNELAKPSNLLEYRPKNSTNSVFFQTIRSDEYEVDNQFVPGQTWRITCTVLAAPFAIGVRQDLAQVTVTNDPASGTNAARVDMTGIIGDAPTPAFIRFSGPGAGGTMVVAQRTRNNPTALTLRAQCESGTLGTDTASSAAANTSGGSGAYCTFATNANLTTRLTLAVPTASDATALNGRYRVLIRLHCADTTSTFNLRYLQHPSGTGVYGPITAFQAASTTNWYLWDLGVVDYPGWQAPAALGYSGLASALAAESLGIQAQRVSGSGNLDMDYVVLLPADERMCAVSPSAAVAYVVLDGPNDAAYGMAAGTTPFGATRTIDNAGGVVARKGGIPQLVPGVTNRWTVLHMTDTVASTRTMDVSYWPRWREVAAS